MKFFCGDIMRFKKYLYVYLLLLIGIMLNASEKTEQIPLVVYEEHIVHLDLPSGLPNRHNNDEALIQFISLLVDSRIKNGQSLDIPIEGSLLDEGWDCIPLHLICGTDKANTLVKKILAHGGSPNSIFLTQYIKRTPLYIAVEGLATQNIKTLSQAGANTEWHDGWGETPLIKTCWGADGVDIKEKYGIVEALLAAGANPNAQDYVGFTPLFCLVRGDETSKYPIKLLLKYGARTDLVNYKNETVFTFARNRLRRENARMLADYIEQEQKHMK